MVMHEKDLPPEKRQNSLAWKVGTSRCGRSSHCERRVRPKKVLVYAYERSTLAKDVNEMRVSQFSINDFRVQHFIRAVAFPDQRTTSRYMARHSTFVQSTVRQRMGLFSILLTSLGSSSTTLSTLRSPSKPSQDRLGVDHSSQSTDRTTVVAKMT